MDLDNLSLPIDKIEAMFGRLIILVTKSFNQTMSKVVDAMESKLAGRFDAQASEYLTLNQRLDNSRHGREKNWRIVNWSLKSQVN